MGSGAGLGATATLTVYATARETATDVRKATVTQGVETVWVTIAESAAPTSTSAAAKKKTGFDGFSTSVKAGVGLEIACAAAAGLSLVATIGGYGVLCLVSLWRMSTPWARKEWKKWRSGRSE
jgi:hypothetical protein